MGTSFGQKEGHVNFWKLAAFGAACLTASCAKVVVEDDDDGVIIISTSSTSTGTGGEGGAPPPPVCPPLEVAHDTEQEWYDAIVTPSGTFVTGRYVVTNGCDIERDMASAHIARLDETKPSSVSSLQLVFPDGGGVTSPLIPVPDDIAFTVQPGIFTIPARGSLAFDVVAGFSKTHPSSFMDVSAARSGDRIRLTVDGLTDEDGVAAKIDDTFMEPTYLLRASAPLVDIAYDMPPLANGLNTVFRMEMTNDGNVNPFGLRQLVLNLVAPGVTLSAEGLNPFLVNGVEVTDGAFYPSESFGGTAVLTFSDDMEVTSTDLYTIELQLNASGVTSGAYVIASLDGSLGAWPPNLQPAGLMNPGLLTLAPDEPNQNLTTTSAFIWTDFAEEDGHDPNFGGSFDYYTMYLLPGGAGVSASFAP